ncbi:flagellar assembly protein FliW [Ruminococcaceae bacterium OttesenSCG-928-I18]|nr:flagellar assembly protein FliW [Ruminococcaceae bacterium OttesenSCG-928-I18]
MTIQTRDFGVMELDENELLTFRSPIYGYEELSQYALLTFETTGDGISWLQSVDDPEICFILLDPEEVGLPYHPSLPSEVTELLGGEESIVFRLIAVVPENFHDTTVNLKSPIVINTEKRLAAQVILDEDQPIRMRLFGAQEEATC